MNNEVFDVSLGILVDCLENKSSFQAKIKDLNFKKKKVDTKTITSICGIVLRNYYLIKNFANKVLNFKENNLVLATGIVFGSVAFNKIEDTSSAFVWYKQHLIYSGIEYNESYENKLKELIKSKKNYHFDEPIKEFQRLSISTNLPVWLIKMIYSQFGKDTMYKVTREIARMPKQFAYKPSWSAIKDENLGELNNFNEIEDKLYLFKSEKSIKSSPLIHEYNLYPLQVAENDLAKKLSNFKNQEVLIYSKTKDYGLIPLIDKLHTDNKLHVIHNDPKKLLYVLNEIRKILGDDSFDFYTSSESGSLVYLPYKQDLIVYYPQSSSIEDGRRAPDYLINFDINSLDSLIKDQLNGLDELDKLLNVGGELVYAVPTIDIKETEVIMIKFLENHKNYYKVESRYYMPNEKENSLYYFAILKKNK